MYIIIIIVTVQVEMITVSRRNCCRRNSVNYRRRSVALLSVVYEMKR